GLQLFWNPDDNGAHFVLYSDHGQLIPSQEPIWSEPWEPILQVTVEKIATKSGGGDDDAPADGDPGDGDPEGTGPVRLEAQNLLAADSLGHGVPPCLQVIDTRQVAHDRAATLCPAGAGSECDVNHDGHADVRDLVVMAQCITGASACPDTAGGVL